MIETIINNQPIAGHFIYRSESEMEIALDDPYAGFTATARCTSMSGCHVQSGWTGEEGMRVAMKSLEYLYCIAKHLHDHREKLVQAYQDYASRLVELNCSVNTLSDRYFALAQENLVNDLEADRISFDDLEAKRVELRMMHSRYHETREVIRNEFFEENFPFEVLESVRDQVLVWLRREEARNQ